MILVRVSLQAHDERTTPTLRDLLIDSMAASRQEDGCIEYRFTADLEIPGAFHVVELWRDDVAVKGHMTSESFRRFAGALPALGRITESTWLSGDLTPYSRDRAMSAPVVT